MNILDKVFNIIIKVLTYINNINALSGNTFTPWLLDKLGVTKTTTKRKKATKSKKTAKSKKTTNRKKKVTKVD